jgi:hypothetical protein
VPLSGVMGGEGGGGNGSVSIEELQLVLARVLILNSRLNSYFI